MNTYQRLYTLSEKLKKDKIELLEGLVISTPSDYAGIRFVLGQAQKIDDILKLIDSILKDS